MKDTNVYVLFNLSWIFIQFLLKKILFWNVSEREFENIFVLNEE
jgi:hypothetical protein